ncbi:MAG: Tfx family DNA-binding protein [Methanotrichaceae archaeon]
MKEQDKLEASSFLTERQLAVLRLRRKGLSQQEVAEILRTTRSNVSILEKRAFQNVDRAKATFRQWMMIQAPVSVKIAAGTDVFEVPRLIFQKADLAGIKSLLNSVDVIVQLRNKVPPVLKKRIVFKDLKIYVTEDGKILIQDAESTAHD